MELVVASNNPHKLDEIRTLLADWEIVVRPLADFPHIPEPPEEEPTFEGNAQSKAVFVHRVTGGWVLADDSGLEVDALDGAPGVRSKRFTPEATAAANNAHLLEVLGDRDHRTARFRTSLALIDPAGEVVCFDGRCEGSITRSPRGAHGFGYDPLFMPDACPGVTMAELDMTQKNRISHRGSALRQFRDHLRVSELISNLP